MPVNIRITTNEIDSSGNIVDEKTNAVASNQNNTAKKVMTSGTETVARSVYVNQLVQVGMSSAKSMATYAVNQYGDFTGDYLKQTQINNALDNISVVTNIGSSVVGGAISGAMAGGVEGAIVGAVVGGTVSMASLAVEGIQSIHTYSKSINKTNAAASFNSSRIGSILMNGNRG